MVLGRLKGARTMSLLSHLRSWFPALLTGWPTVQRQLGCSAGAPHSSTHLVERYRSTLHARPLGAWIALERNVISAAVCGLVVGTVHQ